MFTIGYGNLKIDDFCRIVKEKGNLIIDVRRYPNSGRHEYKVGVFVEKLVEYGIDYIWMGNFLGGKSLYTGPRGNFNIIPLLTKERRNGVIMCCESVPSSCHRVLIAEELGRFIEVNHIIGKNGVTIKHSDLAWDYRNIPTQRSAK